MYVLFDRYFAKFIFSLNFQFKKKKIKFLKYLDSFKGINI